MTTPAAHDHQCSVCGQWVDATGTDQSGFTRCDSSPAKQHMPVTPERLADLTAARFGDY